MVRIACFGPAVSRLDLKEYGPHRLRVGVEDLSSLGLKLGCSPYTNSPKKNGLSWGGHDNPY